ncbi:MAG TPA: class I SAM-dependent methyltransferase [Kofleriaceae bacterium]|jgi:SAM-dependent methyltransferase|nr:class I SAM-dependent methyltransferase [Kofleriaceae bacterium]
MVIPFEPHRFRDAAAEYLAGRAPYAPRLFERIALLCRLDQTSRVLDLGCGPGQIARALAPLVGHVVGVDPERNMLDVARAAAPQLEWIEASSYELAALALRDLALVTMGRAFHWMDRRATLAELDRMIARDGAVALISDDHPDVPANAWHVAFKAITDRFGEADPAKAMRKANWLTHEAVLLDSPFCELETISVVCSRRVTIDSLVARTRTMSSVRAHAADFEAELRETLAPFEPITEVTASKALLARRPTA